MCAAAKRPELLPPCVASFTHLREEVARARKALEAHGADVVLGHGDCKPSNVIASDDGPAKLIDFELGGPNYRDFDLMKLFRTAAAPSEPCMLHFLRAYAAAADLACDESAIRASLVAARRFEPLTWLEACIFFLALPEFKPDELSRWQALAVDRWEKYQKTRHHLIPN